MYLEQFKYRQKKKKLINFIDAELEDLSDDNELDNSSNDNDNSTNF